MRTVEKVEQLTSLAEEMGYSIRYEPLAGSGGGVCEFGGRRFIFIDLSLSVDERLDLIVTSLASDPSLPVSQLNDDLKSIFGIQRRAAA